MIYIGIALYVAVFVWIGYQDKIDLELFEDVSKRRVGDEVE